MSRKLLSKRLAIRLRDARLALGLSQAKAAKSLNKPQSYVSRCESGLRRVDIFELEEFARVYQIQLGFFIHENQSSSYSSDSTNQTKPMLQPKGIVQSR